MSKGWQERVKAGRILSSSKPDSGTFPEQPQLQEGSPDPHGVLSQLQKCFSQVAVTLCPSLCERDTRLKVVLVARPICSRHQGPCCLQEALEQLEACYVGTGGHGKKVLLLSGVVLLDCLYPEGWVQRAQSAPFNSPSLYLSSQQTQLPAPLLFYPVLLCWVYTQISATNQEWPWKLGLVSLKVSML